MMIATKVYTAAQMRAAENAAVARGISLLQLMENAGQGAAQEILHRFPNMKRVLMVCGKGNNGGDALVMARGLAAHGVASDVVFLLGDTLSELAQINRAQLPTDTRILSADTVCLNDYDVLVDAVFGTGFAGDLPASVASFFRQLNAAAAHKVALDIPSGMNCDSGAVSPDTFRADITYAFGAYKPAHLMTAALPYCGEVCCISIGV